MRQSLVLVSSILAALLLFTAALPVLDHHSAERAPGHGHLMVTGGIPALDGDANGAHVHLYQMWHSHDQDKHMTVPSPSVQRSPHAVVTSAVLTETTGADARHGITGVWLGAGAYIPLPNLLCPMCAVPIAAPKLMVVSPLERPPISHA